MPHSHSVHPGLRVLSRLLAAIFGGYALASALAIFLAAALPGARADAVMAGMQWSFVLHVLAMVWAFSPVAASLCPAVWAWGATAGTVAWLGFVSAGALLAVALISWRAR